MKKYSANYTHTNHNFVIQNLKGDRIENDYLPAISIIKNILQRGKPTLLSDYLQKKLGKIHQSEDFVKSRPLISKETPVWRHTILGAAENDFYPARTFFENLPEYLPEYPFIQQLMIPEMEINEITKVYSEGFVQQRVDFYLPQAYLIIEIDGSQHLEEPHLSLDVQRDAHTARFGMKTVRISVQDFVAKNDVFYQKIEEIKTRLAAIKKEQIERRKINKIFHSLEDYQIAFEKGINVEKANYKATAIIRFQILLLELLEKGELVFDDTWKIALYSNDIKPSFCKLAIEDLFIWFKHILQLQKLDFKKPIVEVAICKTIEELTAQNTSIKVDFSLLKRYTDENMNNPTILFIRNDYLEEYKWFQGNRKFLGYKKYDYFQISTAPIIDYNLALDRNSKDRKSLKFLLYNLFLQGQEGLTLEDVDFREGQLPIIANALSRKDTIGLLPTGSGKSVCYQLAAILQPAVSFVVCPIKSLMYDQKVDLDAVGFNRTNHITSDNSAEEKARILEEFGSGKYFFIFISPERFQIKSFRDSFTKVNNDFTIAYSVIDEVHCLSEWGHDFRTSYLNLANTIDRLCPNSKYLGLTATASFNVLKDIQIEFGISQENVMTPVNYTREELEFIILDDGGKKLPLIKKKLTELQQDIGALEVSGEDSKCGIIFTPFVNGAKGCYKLSQKLQKSFDKDVKYYSGKIPKIKGLSKKDFDEYKKQVQIDFKKNRFTLLTATKAFGMGINKGNIHYTFHYGIPGSMEALYQEAGRAGRNKSKFVEEKAKCFVLLSKAIANTALKQVWNKDTSLSQLKRIMPNIRGDVNSNLFLFTNGLDIISNEFQDIRLLHNIYSISNLSKVIVTGNRLNLKKTKVEKGIYRLHQLGIIKDWTIENFFGGGVFEVEYNNYTEESIRDALLDNIQKYDKEFSLEAVINKENERYNIYRKILVEAPKDYTNTDKYILLLLQWSYDNFAYNRRQSLKNIYENCCAYTDGEISPAEFKIRLENYFKFTQTTFVLQHIAEHPYDSTKWFDVFYQVVNNRRGRFIKRKEQEALRDNLSRLLESYRNNTGLDLISGLVRLLLDDYENQDGRFRLEGTLAYIKNRDQKEQIEILKGILIIGKQLNESLRNVLAETLYKEFNTSEYLYLIHENLKDTFSINILLSIANERLNQINSKLNDPLKELGDA